MLEEFATIQGRETLSNFLFEPLVVMDVALHQIFDYLIRTTPGLDRNAVKLVFQIRGEAYLHAVSVGLGDRAVNMAAGQKRR